MKTAQKLKIFSLLMAMPFVTNAALDCHSGQLLNVSGSVDTNSLSAEVQSGVMHLQLSDASGVVYTKDCGLIGKIIKQDSTGPILDHTVICSAKDSFDTSEDVATVTGGAYPIFSVTEVVSDIEEGEGLFKNMRANMTVTGTVNYSYPFNNNFTLTGEVCLKKNKKK
jgi:hypothetical protein